jgi:hypothetical protein
MVKITLDFDVTACVVGACIAARKGDVAAMRYLVNGNPDERRVMRDFFNGKIKLPRGRPVSSFSERRADFNLWLVTLRDDQMRRLHDEGHPAPLKEASHRVAEYAQEQGHSDVTPAIVYKLKRLRK